MSRDPFTIATIKATVAARAGLQVADLNGVRRTQPLARWRQVAMWLAREMTGFSTTSIGRAFGGRDHTTVIHAVRAVEARRTADPAFAGSLAAVRRQLDETLDRRAEARAWRAALREAARAAVLEMGGEALSRLREAAERDPLGVMAKLRRLDEMPEAPCCLEGEDATRL